MRGIPIKGETNEERLQRRRGYSRKYYRTHKDKELIRHKKYCASHPEFRKKKATNQRKYYKDNYKHYRDYVNIKNRTAREKVLIHYSGAQPRCACCGEDIIDFLTVDHINNDGAKHRRSLIKNPNTRAAGNKTVQWIIKNNFPEGFRILCWNCNCGRHKRNGVCPHKLKPGYEGE